MAKVNIHRRLECENVDINLEIPTKFGEPPAVHLLTAALAYDERGVLREINFVSRGKIGHGIDLMLHELGIKLSRAIQGRDPENNEETSNEKQTQSKTGIRG